MADIKAKDVAALRAKTGIGMMECKKALVEAEGDFDKAIKILRERGLAVAAKKADRIAAEGLVYSYIHMGGKIGVLVEVNCETDFVARSEQFVELCKNIALHIAAANPKYVSVAEVPQEDVEHEKSILRAQAENEGKKPEIIEKMVEGRIKKFYQDFVLYEQSYVKDSEKTITQLINESVLTIGEKITIRRFVRFEMGEGLEKRKDNFAEEVMSQTK